MEKMEQNQPVITKRIWNILRVVFFMVRRGISKRKLMLDLDVMLKRGKIAGKAIGNLMLFNHHDHRRGVSSSFEPPREYEFSCSNTPNYTFPFHLTNKRKNNSASYHNFNFFAACTHAPPTHEYDVDHDLTTMNAVKVMLEMLNNDMAAEASPVLPGFGRTPLARQLRVTDSPFPLRDVDEDNGYVDRAAEEFINKFYKDLKQQNLRMASVIPVGV